jgi:hypothetical protein
MAAAVQRGSGSTVHEIREWEDWLRGKRIVRDSVGSVSVVKDSKLQLIRSTVHREQRGNQRSSSFNNLQIFKETGGQENSAFSARDK